MPSNRGLLGVGGGVISPKWVQELSGEEATARDTSILKSSVNELLYQATKYSMSINLPSIAANSTSQIDQAIPAADAGKVLANDYPMFMGADALNHGLIVQGTLPAPSNGTIRLRVSNVTGGAIDAAATTFYFVVVRKFST